MTGNEATAMPGRDDKLRKGFVVPDAGQRETLAARRRRESRREEFAEQALLVAMLQELLDPAVVLLRRWRTGRGRPGPVSFKSAAVCEPV
jgi:hypothetical protein